MPDLLLKHIGRRGEEHYDVLADGTVVGRIMMFADTPAGKPWMWSLAYGQHEDRTPTHGYEPTREAAMSLSYLEIMSPSSAPIARGQR